MAMTHDEFDEWIDWSLDYDYKCDVCGSTFNKDEVLSHTRKHIKDSESLYIQFASTPISFPIKFVAKSKELQ